MIKFKNENSKRVLIPNPPEIEDYLSEKMLKNLPPLLNCLNIFVKKLY